MFRSRKLTWRQYSDLLDSLDRLLDERSINWNEFWKKYEKLQERVGRLKIKKADSLSYLRAFCEKYHIYYSPLKDGRLLQEKLLQLTTSQGFAEILWEMYQIDCDQAVLFGITKPELWTIRTQDRVYSVFTEYDLPMLKEMPPQQLLQMMIRLQEEYSLLLDEEPMENEKVSRLKSALSRIS